MTTNKEIPTLEELLGADKIEALKDEIAAVSSETYQPLLDLLGERLHFSHTEAVVTAKVELELVEVEDKPVVTNNVVLGITFTPTHTHDPFEEANRIILAELFARSIQK